MATNKESCAVHFQLLLSLTSISFMIFAAYWISYCDNKGKGSFKNHNLMLNFIVINAISEVVLIVQNRKLKSKYWEQEVIAIKRAYNQGGGIRSRNLSNTPDGSNVKLIKSMNKKQEKQIILRKLQLELVTDYLKWVSILTIFKIMVLCLYVNKTYFQNKTLKIQLFPLDKNPLDKILSWSN